MLEPLVAAKTMLWSSHIAAGEDTRAAAGNDLLSWPTAARITQLAGGGPS